MRVTFLPCRRAIRFPLRSVCWITTTSESGNPACLRRAAIAWAALSVLPELSDVLISMSSLNRSRAVESHLVRPMCWALATAGTAASSKAAEATHVVNRVIMKRSRLKESSHGSGNWRRRYCAGPRPMASQMSGSVALVCPRYCGRKPYSTTFPLPTVASTSAALPYSRSGPISQPETRAFPEDS